MSAMATYYRVNLKDKQNNIVYPNVHNNWIFQPNGSVILQSGSIILQHGYITLNGDISRVMVKVDASLSNNNVSSNIYSTTFSILDKSKKIINRLECIPKSNGNIDSYWYVRNYKTDGTMVAQKGISMSMNKDGALTYSISDPANFRSAISAVNKAGDILTGNLSYNMNGSTQIPFKVYGGDNNGQGISVGAGGATIVGSGESAKACESLLTATTEETWITSNNAIKFYTNCQTIGNKVGVFLNSSRAFYPDTDNTGSLGTSTNKWNNIYSNNLTIQNKTSETVTYADKQNPRINFVNVDGSQAVSLIFTDYDTYKTPYGLTLIGNGQSTDNGGAYLKVEGDIQSNTITSPKINSSLTTGTHINGNKGGAIINSTAANTGGYTMLARMKSRNGVWTFGAWDASFDLFYTADSVISAGTNAYTKMVKFLDENGNSSFPGTISATGINGYASYPQGFNGKTGSQTWGNQDGTFVTGWSATGGSDIAFRANSGQLNVIIDGYYYCNEGKGRCIYSLDSSVRNMYANTIGTWNSNYSKYVNGTIMFCW